MLAFFPRSIIRRAAFRLVVLTTFLPITIPATEEIESTSQGIEHRLEFLRAEIRRHDELYYRKAAPEISDAEYDRLKREFQTLSQSSATPLAMQPGVIPAYSTDDRVPGFTTYRHQERMLSLEKAYSKTELRRFYDRLIRELGTHQLTVVVEPKFDGMAISATYENGVLTRVLTRGDGESGDDVTTNAKRYLQFPEKLTVIDGKTFPDRVEIRGEVYVSSAEFERLNRARSDAGESKFVSPRNLAAGTLKLLREQEISPRNLSIVFYGIGAISSIMERPNSHLNLLSRLKEWGLPTPEKTRVAASFDQLWSAVSELQSERSAYPFPKDGVVVKLDSVPLQQRVGTGAEGPRWAIAVKSTAVRLTTRLSGIILEVGRTGVITPVADLEPVDFGGAVVRRATLHNADEIARRDYRIGDFVMVERGGEVIPAVVGVDFTRRSLASQSYVFPTTCPSCVSTLVRRGNRGSWRCVNPDCRAQLKRRIEHFLSPSCLGIDGLGEVFIGQLVEAGSIKNVSDVYRLEAADLQATCPGVSAQAVIDSIMISRDAELWRFVFALGIHGIGMTRSKALARHFGSLERLGAATLDELRNVEGISSDHARTIAAFFQALEGKAVLSTFRSFGIGAAAGTSVVNDS